MTVNLRILVPEATTNFVTNPSMRYDTTGYTAVGSSLSRSLDYARFNIASLKVVTNGSVLGEGFYYRLNSLAGISDTFTASIYLRGSGIVRLRLIDNPIGKQWFSQSIFLDDAWTRVDVSGYSDGSNDLRIYVETDVRSQAITFYVDGVQLEQKPYSTSFCDGDQGGCNWNGLFHSSSSSRSAYTRAGGKWVPLAGPCRDNDNIYVTMTSGLGAPPISNQFQSLALEAGSIFQDTKMNSRQMVFTFFVKNIKLFKPSIPDLAPIHALRQQLIDIFKPDVTEDGESFLLEYKVGNRPLYIRARYKSGLEGQWDIRNQWVNTFNVVLWADDPLFTEDNQNVQQMQISKTFSKPATSYSNLYRRINGEWFPISIDGTGYFATDQVFWAMALGTKGEVYVCGNIVAKYDGTTLTNISDPSVGSSNPRFWGCAVDTNGDLYVVGQFTQIGGVAANNIAKWNGTAWSALGAGLSAQGTSICIADNGQIYVVGNFLTAGGISSPLCARWDRFQWRSVGTPPGLPSDITAGVGITKGIDGKTIYVSGQPPVTTHVYSLNTDTNLFTALGDIFNWTPNVLITDKDGTLYAGGFFYQYGTSPIYLRKLAFWNGETWTQIGDGLSQLNDTTEAVFALAFDLNGDLLIGGRFTNAGLVNNNNLVKWSGDRRASGKWNGPDFSCKPFGAPDSTDIEDILVHPNGDIYLCGRALTHNFAASYASAINTVTNTGSAEVHPYLYLKGPGTFKFLRNWTTGKELIFSVVLLNNEEIIIDFGVGRIISTIRGDMSYAIVPVTKIREFTLVPGDNRIAAMMINDVNAIMQIGYIPTHESADATVSIQELQ